MKKIIIFFGCMSILSCLPQENTELDPKAEIEVSKSKNTTTTTSTDTSTTSTPTSTTTTTTTSAPTFGFSGASSVSILTSTSLKVEWSAATGTKTSYYRIYQYNINTSEMTALATVSSSNTSYSHTGLTAGQEYSYVVRAFDSALSENDGNTNIVSQIPYAGITSGSAFSNTAGTLQFPAITSGTGIALYCKTSNTDYSLMTTANISDTSASISGLSGSTQYTCQARAIGSMGTYSNDTTASFTTTGTLASLSFSTGASIDFGSKAKLKRTSQTITITNAGEETATNLSGAFTTGTHFRFHGGTFPGTNGTCGSTLAGAATCTVVIVYDPQTTGNLSDTLTFSFQNGAANSSGAIALSGSATTPVPTKVRVGAGRGCAISDNDQVKCWGYGVYGSTSYADRLLSPSSAMSPELSFGTGRTVSQLVAGESFYCARLDNGEVKCWGDNTYGQLGRGDTLPYGYKSAHWGDSFAAINLGTNRTATSIAAGNLHVCAILDTGYAKCWGDGAYGKLGTSAVLDLGDGSGEMGDSLSYLPTGGVTVSKIQASREFTCLILTNGKVHCFGYNNKGQLGLGHTTDKYLADILSTPVSLDGTTDTATDIAVGESHTCAVRTSDSKAVCWGYGANGRLGTGATSDIGDGAGEMGANLVAIVLPDTITASKVFAGFSTSYVLGSNGKVYPVGQASFMSLGTGSNTADIDTAGEMGNNFTEVQLSTNFTALVTSVRTAKIMSSSTSDHACFYSSALAGLKCIGNNLYGKLGDGTETNRYSSTSDSQLVNLGSNRTPTSEFALSLHSTCAVMDNGLVKCWGATGHSSWSHGGFFSPYFPYPGPLPDSMGENLMVLNLGSERSVQDVRHGLVNTCYLLDNGDVKCLGRGDYGSNGNGSSSHMMYGEVTGDDIPSVILGNGNTAKAIGSGMYNACAILQNDKLKCWGLYSQYTGGSSGTTEASMTALSTLDFNTAEDTVIQIAMGSSHICAIIDDTSATGNQSLRCWGTNADGQLGYGDTTERTGNGHLPSLAAVNLGAGRYPVQVEAGDKFTIVLLDDGSVKAFGDGFYGMMGSGATADATSPVTVDLNGTVSSLGQGDGSYNYSLCAHMSDASTKCWGYGVYGQLANNGVATIGDGANEMGANLVASSFGTGRTATQVSLGGHGGMCALLDNNTIKCYGNPFSLHHLGISSTTGSTPAGYNYGGSAGYGGDNVPVLSLW